MKESPLTADQHVRLELVKTFINMKGFELYRAGFETLIEDSIEPSVQYIIGKSGNKKAAARKKAAAPKPGSAQSD